MISLVWTEPMEVLLLELVISSGAHMAAEGERARNLWMQVNKDIFLNYPFACFKEELYKENEYHLLLEKFTAMKR